MALTLPLALGMIVVPWFMLRAAPTFPLRLPLTALFVLVAAERIWAMFFRQRDPPRVRAQGDWTALAVGLAYAGVMYGSISELLFLRARATSVPILAVGACLYVSAVSIRYWAFEHLGSQWAVHVDQSEGQRQLVTTGPYGLVRHPLYLSACMEVLSVPLMFGAYWSLLGAALVFVPVEVARARFEEGFLRRIFGAQYAEYARRTRGFVPLPRGSRPDGEGPVDGAARSRSRGKR